MKPEIKELLEDILDEANSIKEFVSEHTFDSYCQDKKTRFAVERSFEIIGEALNKIKNIDAGILGKITD